MSESIFERITTFLGKKSAVQRVAEDPALAAELLLLLHVVFADGDRHPAEITIFKEIILENFGIPPEEIPEVAEYLKDFAYETTTKQAASMLAEMAPERRLSLLNDLMKIACADSRIDQSETAMIQHIAEVLGVTAEELREARQASPCGS
ncbi:TerB family tellurite resistance protein [Falsochrobactrum sp. TDYN1]|uniref:TerB family tellurite resistance protein n=1 Tax=Falsochrobactrum tianjinense TaxID=2706015 RepID=A0A949PPW1_9HYPH|nr:TerB family tellurite resistance protein [Falsochrobactrum sp. TDYN1]MBV2143846.1 TerB family tellurite resistance protein [Falsochrobactrum sp. TDYN1]